MESASVTPKTSDSAMTIHGCTLRIMRSATSSVGQNICIDWNAPVIRRLFALSASIPPNRISSDTGYYCPWPLGLGDIDLSLTAVNASRGKPG
jgi:hypothetical protein